MVERLRIGLDTSLLNKGFPLPFVSEEARPGLEIEECNTLMRVLNWTYEFIIYENNVGYVANGSGNSSSGMLGDLAAGKLDMICARLRMTETRRSAYDFSFPISVTVKQVYVLKNMFAIRSQAHNFIVKPFTATVWLLLIAATMLFMLLFCIFRLIYEKKSPVEALKSAAWYIIKIMTRVEGNFTIPNMLIERYAIIFWIVLWVHIFSDYYTSDMIGFLTVPNKIILPFQDFNGFVQKMEMGQYYLLNSQTGRMPECPKFYLDDCSAIFDRLFRKFPPVIDNISRIIESREPLVSVMWYSDDRVPYRVSHWLDYGYRTDLLAIRDDQVQIAPAAYAFRKGFLFMADVDDAVVEMFPAFERIARRYSPPYPRAPLSPPVHQIELSMSRLLTAFGLWAAGMTTGTIMFLIERQKKKTLNKNGFWATMVQNSANWSLERRSSFGNDRL